MTPALQKRSALKCDGGTIPQSEAQRDNEHSNQKRSALELAGRIIPEAKPMGIVSTTIANKVY